MQVSKRAIRLPTQVPLYVWPKHVGACGEAHLARPAKRGQKMACDWRRLPGGTSRSPQRGVSLACGPGRQILDTTKYRLRRWTAHSGESQLGLRSCSSDLAYPASHVRLLGGAAMPRIRTRRLGARIRSCSRRLQPTACCAHAAFQFQLLTVSFRPYRSTLVFLAFV